MSLFKKILGQRPKEASRPQIERIPRIVVTSLHRIMFRESFGMMTQVANISAGGMALIREAAHGWKKDDTLQGALIIDQNEYEIEARIKHLDSTLAGCQFVSDRTDFKKAIHNYLKVEILALTLRPVSKEYLKADPRGEVHWLTDGRQNEFYCVTDTNGVVAFNMSFLGTYVEGGRATSLRTGSVRATATGEARHKGAELLDLANQPTHDTLKLAEIFVQNIERLDSSIRAQLSSMIVDKAA